MQHTESMVGVKSRRSQHTADTRTGLLRAARRLFAEHGYANVTLDEVCQRGRVTKGALYHHFENKKDLFLGVYEQVEDDLVAAGGAAASSGGDFWALLSAAGRGFLDVIARPDTRQIVIDAPAVLGWAAARAAEERASLGQLQTGVEAAVEAGVVESESPALLARLLFALFHEAAMTVAASEDPVRTKAAVAAELDRLLNGLRPR